MRFSPKILGLNVGMFGLFSGSLGLCLEIGLKPGLMSSGFVVYLEFRVVLAKFWK